MSSVIADFLQSLPCELHDNFLKLVEHDFWKFQYACRHFQSQYKENMDMDFSNTEIRNHPHFKQASKYLKAQVKKREENDPFDDIALRDIDRWLQNFKQIGQDLPDEIIEAVKKNVQLDDEDGDRPRKALKNQFVTDNRMRLLPIQLKILATENCGVSQVDFEKMINGRLTSEEWENNDSIQRFCEDIRRRIRYAVDRERQEFEMMPNLERGFEREYISTNKFLLDVADEFGASYFICDLFRHTDVVKTFPFNKDNYKQILKSTLASGTFWQPVPHKSAVDWIYWYVTTCRQFEPYISIMSYTCELGSSMECMNLPMWDRDDGSKILISVNCIDNSISVSDLNKKILKLEKEIGYRLGRLKDIGKRRMKKELSRDDIIWFSDKTFTVVLNAVDAPEIDSSLVTFIVWVHFDHQKFELKKAIDMLRITYFYHAYKLFHSLEYVELINGDVPIVSNFKSGTIVRLIALYLWDQVNHHGIKLNNAIFTLSKLLPDVICGDQYSNEYLEKAYKITDNCIEKNRVLSIK